MIRSAGTHEMGWTIKVDETLCEDRSDDAEQPKDEDQDQQTTKTDIHLHSSRFVLVLKRWE